VPKLGYVPGCHELRKRRVFSVGDEQAIPAQDERTGWLVGDAALAGRGDLTTWDSVNPVMVAISCGLTFSWLSRCSATAIGCLCSSAKANAVVPIFRCIQSSTVASPHKNIDRS
jgi:hypothetical protein